MPISKRRLKDGSIVYDVREDVGFTLNGRRDRKSVTCKTAREAKREQARLVAMRDATRNRSGRITLAAYVDQWYRPLMAELAASSRDVYERELRLRIMPYLGSYDIRDIDRAKVQRMIGACQTQSVAKKAVGVLRTILNQAIGDSLIVTNVATARYALPPAGTPRDNGFVLGSFDLMPPILEAARGWKDGTVEKLCITGLLMGMRPEERYGLDWTDFDWEGGSVRIDRAYTAVSRAEGTNDLKGPKTALSARDIPLTGYALDRLRTHFIAEGRKTGPMMLGYSRKRLSPSTARKRWNRFLDGHPSLPKVTLENMRHSFATSYLAAGGNVENLSRLLGHSDINTTFSRYVRPSSRSMREEMERMSSLLDMNL